MAVAIGTLQQLMLPVTPLDAGGAVIVRGPLYSASVVSDDTKPSTFKFSWRSSIYFGDQATTRHVKCKPIPEACAELLRHRHADLTVTLLPLPSLLNLGSAEAWIISANANGLPIVRQSDQDAAYASYRRIRLQIMAIVGFVFLGAAIYALLKKDRT